MRRVVLYNKWCILTAVMLVGALHSCISKDEFVGDWELIKIENLTSITNNQASDFHSTTTEHFLSFGPGKSIFSYEYPCFIEETGRYSIDGDSMVIEFYFDDNIWYQRNHFEFKNDTIKFRRKNNGLEFRYTYVRDTANYENPFEKGQAIVPVVCLEDFKWEYYRSYPLHPTTVDTTKYHTPLYIDLSSQNGAFFKWNNNYLHYMSGTDTIHLKVNGYSGKSIHFRPCEIDSVNNLSVIGNAAFEYVRYRF